MLFFLGAKNRPSILSPQTKQQKNGQLPPNEIFGISPPLVAQSLRDELYPEITGALLRHPAQQTIGCILIRAAERAGAGGENTLG